MVKSKVVNSLEFGEAIVPEVLFENPDGGLVLFDTDYFNVSREASGNLVGPFSSIMVKNSWIKVWPR